MDIQRLSGETGCDLQAAITRLGGMKALYERLLQKFLDDTTFQELEAAVREMDPERMERAAHTLKGVAANLGFTTLSSAGQEMVNAVRTGENVRAAELFVPLKEQYERIMAAVRAELT